MSSPHSPEIVHAKRVMPVIALSLITVVSAVVGLNVALPDLARSTGATQTQLTWIVDSYTVVFAALLFFAGALGDRFGRKRLLIIGLAIFGLAAIAGAFVESPTALIVVRAFMGVGASAVMPTTLSVITTSFPEEERPKAIGAWVGMAGAGAIIGLWATAILLEYFAWNSFFWLNAVLAALAILGTIARVPESTDEHPPGLDIVGGTLSLIGMGALVFGIIEGPERGWGDVFTLSALAVGVLGLAAFVAWEMRIDEPLLDPRLFANRSFSISSLSIAVTFFCWFGLIFAIIQYLQFVAGFSPLEAVIRLLPIPFVLLPTARNAPKLAQKIGFRRTVPLGMFFLAVGLLVLSRVSTDFNFFYFAAGLLISAAGMGLSGTPATTAITAALPHSKQGVASAMNDTSRELGSAFGIAILGASITQVYSDEMAKHVQELPEQVAEIIMSSVAFTQAPELARLGDRGQQLADLGRQAFVDGVGSGLQIASGVALVGAIIVALLSPAHSQDG